MIKISALYLIDNASILTTQCVFYVMIYVLRT
ncbi:adhesin [Vibrio cyclitrophicus]|nr:adhesin [Vibrio cyclitrophicus]NOH44460.1 adhesin [Vibrio cyclitrophicus]NOI35159.1 adhesin [Vibrio cyclitrophicus]QCI71452.1 adhesin [Vibrio cyclitrophicus]